MSNYSICVNVHLSIGFFESRFYACFILVNKILVLSLLVCVEKKEVLDEKNNVKQTSKLEEIRYFW